MATAKVTLVHVAVANVHVHVYINSIHSYPVL